jgi:ATP/maltotriose-dependent transcriptional regulator MalT
MLSQISSLQGDYVEARQLLQESLAIAQDIGYSAAVWWSHSDIADTALLQGDYASAQLHYQAGLAVCQELDDRQGMAFVLNGLGHAACGLGSNEEARLYFSEALKLARTFDDRSLTLCVMGGIAWLMAGTNQEDYAAQLVAYVSSQLSDTDMVTMRPTQLLEVLEAVLSPETFTTATEQGKRLDFDETVRTLLAKLSQPLQNEPLPGPRAVVQLLPDLLTEREIDVLRFIADGLSNYEIQ